MFPPDDWMVLLLKAYRGETLSKEEERSLREYCDTTDLIEEIGRMHRQMASGEEKEKSSKVRLPRRVNLIRGSAAVAAAILICIGSVCILSHYASRAHLSTAERPKGSAGADSRTLFVAKEGEILLTRNDGRQIHLEGVRVGSVVAREGNYVLRLTDRNSMVYERADSRADDTVPVWHCVAVGQGRAPWHLRLPDGSEVWLLAGSSYSYPLERKIASVGTLFEGRALFEVKDMASEPFVIRTRSGALIRMLGTRFTVEAGSTTKVVLFNGRLEVSNKHGRIQLRSMQEAVFGAGSIRVLTVRDSAGISEWVRRAGSFAFNNTALKDAIRQVADWYGCQVALDGRVRGVPITGHLERSASVDAVIGLIQKVESNYAYIYRSGSAIVISSKPPAK